MYQAPVIAALIGLSYVWNKVGCWLETKDVPVPLFVHHYGFMYAMLTYLFYAACDSMWADVMNPTQWLDPDVTHDYVVGTMRTNGEYDPSDINGHYQLWLNESTFTDLPGLREFSMLAPLWCGLTILVCIWHTHQHINKIRENRVSGRQGKLCECPQHNQTMTVLILPAVYGLLSFKSTCRMWQVMINHIPVSGHDSHAIGFHSYSERKSFLLEMYDANFMVGDIYETIALVTFGNLVMDVVKKKIDVMMEGMDVIMGSHKDEGAQKHVMDSVGHLVASMKTLTVAGVQLFAGSCLLQGIYALVVTTMAFDFPGVLDSLFSRDESNLGLFQTDAMKDKSHNFFLGCGFIASCAAISNIMIIEEDYHALLHEFKPSKKFWGTKILVSLAFLQSILIQVFLSDWSEIQSDLLYSCCLGLECLAIALFHIIGWSAEEEWYGDYKSISTNQTINAPLLQNQTVPDEYK